MHPEYLYNNDTQEIEQRVCKMALFDEVTLRAQCLEVSRQTDTSSLAIRDRCIEKTSHARSVLTKIEDIFKRLSQSLSADYEVFGTKDGRADFGEVCRAATAIEVERGRLLFCIADLSQMRQMLFEEVANANRILHFLKTAKRAVSVDVKPLYHQAIEWTEEAYARLKRMDVALCEVQDFYMTFVERHMPAFMEQLRVSADFNHAGVALERGAIRSLCHQMLIVTNRVTNITF